MATINRRLGIILCADFVGHNGPGNPAEGSAPTALKAHREAADPLLLREGGRFLNTAGHGVFVEFNSIFNALLASLGVQRLVAERNAELPPDQRVAFRMGIHLGDLAVEDTATSGDGVSTAERLQEIADPGGICLSPAAHAAIHRDFDALFADAGAKLLKGKTAPMRIYTLAPEAVLPPVVPVTTAPRLLLPLVVLPFVNMTGDARHDFLADSVTDQLTAELGRIEDSFVVDRKTALSASAETTDAGELRRRLGIRFVIKGALTVGQSGVRIDAALIDAETDDQIWSDEIEVATSDPFVAQHDANARLVPLLYSRLLAAAGRYPREAAVGAAPVRAEEVAAGDGSAGPRLPVAPLPAQPTAAREAASERPLVPPMVVHPRIAVSPGGLVGRVIAPPPPAPGASRAPSYTAHIREMPTPPLDRRHGRRLPLWWRLGFVGTVAVVIGAIAIALLGVEKDTLIEIVSYMLIGAGIAQLASVIMDRLAPRVAGWRNHEPRTLLQPSG